jgi:2-oxoglutarate dehydrogenase E2 component (dihydrolipoamide succinyltransferase)
MPAAAKLMADNNLATGSVPGTGKDGRVTKGDVLGAVAVGYRQGPAAAPAPARPPGAAASRCAVDARPGRPPRAARADEPPARPRRRAPAAVAVDQRHPDHVQRSQHGPGHGDAQAFQDKFEKEHGVKIGFMSFFVKAAVHALKKYPVLNASVDGNDIVYHGYFDIGIAVGSPRGLVVPILRNADQMSFADIEKKIAEYGKKARDGKLGIEEMTGGTFSISNGGTFGSMLSTPIINPPQSAILGVHATKDRAVVENGQIVIRPMNYLAMSYDHRIIDGREAVLGLVAMKEALEDPARLLFDI